MTLEQLSNCCGAHPQGEIIDGFATCTTCKEMAEFPIICPNCAEDYAELQHVERSQPANSDASFYECPTCNHRFGGDLEQ